MNHEEISYKLFFLGRSCAEKSKIMAELIGAPSIPPESHGIRKNNVYWPTKIWDKIILFRLHCWEASDSGLKKFSHVLPVRFCEFPHVILHVTLFSLFFWGGGA